MNAISNRRGLSLNIKFFLLTALIIVLLIAVTILFSSRRATALAHETIRSDLKQTLSVFETFQKDRYEKLKIANKIIAQNPYIQAYIQESDSNSILDLAKQTEETIRSDFVLLTDADGIVLARTDKPGATGQNFADVPLVAGALDGEEVNGLMLENQNLYHAIAVPVVTQDIITAALAIGYSINDTLAIQIKEMTHSETGFFIEKDGVSLIASTITSEKEDLTRSLTNAGKPDEPFQFQMGPEKYVGVYRPLKNLDGKMLGRFVAFRSLDRELYGFRQFQKNILIVGLGMMVLAFILSFLGSRRITGPLRNLTDAVNEVKEGNYDVPIETTSRDEVGILAESFRKLLAQLKEKQQLVEYLSQQPTVPGAPTIGPGQVSSKHQTTSPSQSSVSLSSIGPGSVIANRYEVQSILGTGGMGVVLKALDRQLDEVVALKLLKGEVFQQDPVALDRFKQELKLARRITHRNVVRTFDYSELDNYYVISMEYVKGITLKQLIRQRGMLPVRIGLQIGKQICSALDAAHERGVVHRDMKPQNVLLESTGDVKIMDFGLARVADMKGMTSTGTIMGTPDYMSPEQAQGLDMDQRTDVYSTGVVLFEVFTGRLPFSADSALVVLNKHIREAPPKPTSFNPALPPALEQVLLRSLEKDPDQRYQKISLLYEDLEAVSAKISTAQERIA
ncbi:protein kinase [bacterium]|nr:protein kinase [bacterium]